MFLYLTNHHAMKTYCGSGGIAPRYISFTPRPGKEPPVPKGRLAGPHYRSAHGDEERDSHPLPGIEP